MTDNRDDQAPLRKHQPHMSGRDLRASSIGWEIALPIVGGPVLGYFIDRHFGTGVTFTLILLGVGLSFSVISLVRFIQYEFTLMEREKEEKKAKQDDYHDKSN